MKRVFIAGPAARLYKNDNKNAEQNNGGDAAAVINDQKDDGGAAGADQPAAGAGLPARVVAIDALPDGVTVQYGDAVLDDAEDMIKAVRSYIRNRVLKQYGVTGINNQTVSQLPIGLNGENVQTRLQLPKVKTTAEGVFCEPMKEYYERCLPAIRTWWKNSLFNTNITVADISKMD